MKIKLPITNYELGIKGIVFILIISVITSFIYFQKKTSRIKPTKRNYKLQITNYELKNKELKNQKNNYQGQSANYGINDFNQVKIPDSNTAQPTSADTESKSKDENKKEEKKSLSNKVVLLPAKVKKKSQGIIAYLRWDFKRAIYEFKKEAAFAPDDPTPYYYLGTTYFDMRDYKNAVLWYEKSLEKSSHDPIILIALGKSFKALGRLDDALILFNLALQIDPQKAIFLPGTADISKKYYDLGLYIYRKGNYAKAIPFFKKATEIEPVSQAYYYLGKIYQQRDWLQQAVEWYKKALDIDVNNPEYHLALGDVYFRLRYFDEADNSYSKAIELDRVNREAYIGLGNVEYIQGNNKLAQNNFKKALEFDPYLFMQFYNWGTAYLQAGILDKAISAYNQSINSNSRYPFTYLNLGIALLKKVAYLEANPLQKEGEAVTSNKETNVSKDVLLETSKAALKRALQMYPFFWKAHLYLGMAYIKEGSFEEGVTELKQAVAINQWDSSAHHILGIGLANLGYSEEALREFRRAVALNNHNAQAHFSLGIAYSNLDMLDLGIKHFIIASRLQPKNQDILLSLAGAYQALGKRDYAANYVGRALAVDPIFAEVLEKEAAVYYDKGLINSAISSYRKLTHVEYTQARPHYILGFLYYIKGIPYVAKKELQQALNLDASLEISPVAKYIISEINQKK